MAEQFASGAAIFVFDEELRILCWNDAAEELTGISAAEAVGRPCWEVIRGTDDHGNSVCHRGCARARIIREGRCLPATVLHARVPEGTRRLAVETISAAGEAGTLFLHVMRDAPQAPNGDRPQPVVVPHLTPRQEEILRLLAEGQPPKAIALGLGLRITTVRNHISALLRELGAHSQLEAVARARELALI